MHSLRGTTGAYLSVCILLTSEPPDSIVFQFQFSVCMRLQLSFTVMQTTYCIFGGKTLWRGLVPGKCTMRPQHSCVKCPSVAMLPSSTSCLFVHRDRHSKLLMTTVYIRRGPPLSIDRPRCSSILPCDRLKQCQPPNPRP